MKEALLVTWYSSHNYGSVLQAYATKELLREKYDIDVSFLNTDSYRSRSIIGTLKKIFCVKTYKTLLAKKRTSKSFSKKGLAELFRKRDQATKSITKDYKFALDNKKIKKESDFEKIGNNFDIYIVGSDQLWNPDFIYPHILLDFVKGKKIKISLSTSLSCDRIPDSKIDIYKKFLSEYRAVTIREAGCIDQLRNINSNVYCTLDPTLIYGKKRWEEKIPHKINKTGYILCYVLGTTTEVRNEIKTLNQKLCKELFYYPHLSDFYVEADEDLNGFQLWDVTPFEWIEYINKADMILTDSYHMTLFSIMFHKDFWVFTKDEKRKSQSNRIIHILKKLGIENRFIEINQINSVCDLNDTINWNMVEKKLSEMVEESTYIWNSIFNDLIREQ